MVNKEFTLCGQKIANRIVFQPMEGFDCKQNGEPDSYTVRKYLRLAEGGAAILWFEANAVCEEGRTNLRQMYLTKENADVFRRLLEQVRETAVKSCLPEQGKKFRSTIIIRKASVMMKTDIWHIMKTASS